MLVEKYSRREKQCVLSETWNVIVVWQGPERAIEIGTPRAINSWAAPHVVPLHTLFSNADAP